MKKTLVVSAMLLCAAAAPAAVKIQGFPSLYLQITDAVHYAISGDTILISTGVYNEAVNIFGKNLTLDGGYTNDCSYKIANAQSVIDGSGLLAGSVLDVTGSVVTLYNLDLRSNQFLITAGAGGGLDIRSGSIVTARNCRIYGNYASGKGGGIYVVDSSLNLFNTQVYTNRARYTAMGGESHGGGGYVENGTLDLDGSSIVSNNTAYGEGGGIYALNSSVFIHHADADIIANSASNGGGMAVNGGFLQIDSNADVANNTAEGWGGGILLRGGATGLVSGAGTSIGYNSAMLGPNSVTNGSGGGICVLDSTLVLSNAARVAHNRASNLGGGIYASNSACRLYGAYVGYVGGTNMAMTGGGIAALQSTVTLAGVSQVLVGRAMGGGGIVASFSEIHVGPEAIIGNADPSYANQAWLGGGMYAGDSPIKLQGKVWNNVALLIGGGGLALEDCQLVASNAQIVGNTAAGIGGGLDWVGGSGTFHNVSMVSNTANYGGGAALRGNLQVEFHPTNIISYNEASLHGGGLYCASTGLISMQRAQVFSNSAGMHGGALCIVTGQLRVGNSQFSGNTAAGHGGAVYVSNAWVFLYADPVPSYINWNRARNGGGLAVEGLGTIELEGFSNIFVSVNQATNGGGGVWVNNGYCFGAGRVNLGGNEAANHGAGACVENGGHLQLRALYGGRPCVYNNWAERSGGGVCATGSSSYVYLRGARVGLDYVGNAGPNRAQGVGMDDGGGGLAVLAGSRCDIESTWVCHNVSSNYGGGINVDGGALTIEGKYADLAPGAFRPPNYIFNNAAPHMAGGGICVIRSVMDIKDALIQSNSAERGGGLYCDVSSTARVVNAVIMQNNASVTGGGVRTAGSIARADLLNCTIVANSKGGLSASALAQISLTNGIVGGNQSEQITAGHSVSYSDVLGGYPGVGNINQNPIFIESNEYDVRLAYSSPCINAGTALASVTTDAIGEPRPFGVQHDMGAYEYNRQTYDSDGDRIPDGWEADRGLNPLNAADAPANSDPDPHINFEEYIADTDPFDGDSHLRIESIADGAARQIGFPSSSNRLYALYATPRMTNDAAWAVVGTNFGLRGNGALYTAVDTNAPAGHAFYRVDVRVP